MKYNNKPGKALAALSSAALLFPAIAPPASADSPPDKIKIGYRFSNYQEDDTKSSKTFGGSSERYEIDIHQFRLVAPVGEHFSTVVDIQKETMSGASPWFTGEDAEGNAKLVMSGASIQDERLDVAANLRYHFSEGNAGFSVRRSDEDDYEADSIAIDGQYDINNRHTTLSAGLSYSDDTITPTQGLIPVDIIQEDKDSKSLFLGVGQVINKNSTFHLGASFTQLSGYLSDPYKKNDLRPDERDQWTLSAGYRYYFADLNAALHTDYRYYEGDWDIQSHTLGIAWYQSFGEYFQLVPSIRYYSQREAKFFSVIADTENEFYADDYRLSSYGAWNAGLKLIGSYHNWSVTVAGQRYKSQASWALNDVDDEAPGLVEFSRYTVGIDYEFD